MLRDLEHEAAALVLRLKCVQNGGQMAFELHVDDGAHHLADAADEVFAAVAIVSLVPRSRLDPCDALAP